MLDYLHIIIPVAAVVVLLVVITLIGYVKAPPDQAYIISGLKKESKVLIGRAGIRIPILERLDKLYLGQMTVDISSFSWHRCLWQFQGIRQNIRKYASCQRTYLP